MTHCQSHSTAEMQGSEGGQGSELEGYLWTEVSQQPGLRVPRVGHERDKTTPRPGIGDRDLGVTPISFTHVLHPDAPVMQA